MAEVSVSGVTKIRVAETSQEIECSLSVSVPQETLDLLPNCDALAIASTVATEAPLSFKDLRQFIENAANTIFKGIDSQSVVAVIMANGPELAVAVLLCMFRRVAAPLDPSTAVAELVQAFKLLEVKDILTLRVHKAYDENIVEASRLAGSNLHYVVKSGSQAGVFLPAPVPIATQAQSPNAVVPTGVSARYTAPNEVALVLRTSGTTSKPKVVPLTNAGLYTGATCIGHGLRLTAQDKCLNVMPYTHIGGISCNLLACLVTQGQVICAPAFDPARFVVWLDQLSPTWYYAVPTIHKALIIFCKGLPEPPKHGLRFIRSGAANLLDADAKEMAEFWKCVILPTYSMSECMPIAQPEAGYDLSRAGAVGLPIASSLRIANENGDAVAFGEDGEVCIKGPVVTLGYLGNDEANKLSFFGDDPEFKWFRTGDVGHLDAQGYIYLTGRQKELIKRGGEQVSPYEVEEVLMSHPAVEVAVVFGVPNKFWGEEVAAAVVLKADKIISGESANNVVKVASVNSVGSTPSNVVGMAVRVANKPLSPQTIAEFTGLALPESKMPKQILILESVEKLPKTRTGKYLRVGLYKQLGVEPVDNAAMEHLKPNLLGADAAPPPVKVDPAIYGLRYCLAVWVTFMHVGDFGEPGNSMRAFSPSMLGFFILAGFLLSSSTTRPVPNSCEFFKNRLSASQPQYFLSVVFAFPLVFLKPMKIEDLLISLPFMLVSILYNQQAWPWGLVMQGVFGEANGPLWFSSAYLFCLFMFPHLHRMLHNRVLFNCCCQGHQPLENCLCCFNLYCCWPFCGCTAIIQSIMVSSWGFITITLYVLAGDEGAMGGFFLGYMFPPFWAAIFFLGMVTFNLFEMHRRSESAQLWAHWGLLTDAFTLMFFLIFAISAVLAAFVDGGFEMMQGLGFMWSRPVRLAVVPICLYIYGLATGKGYAAKLLRTRLMVNYLSPAAYPIYLLHYPIARYIDIVAYGGWRKTELGPIGVWWLFFVTIIVSTMLGMFTQHFMNAFLTTYFVRYCMPWLYCTSCCCNPQEDDVDATTLQKCISAIHGLSNAEVDGSTPLSQCGLDSFGTSALIGVLKVKMPNMKLNPLKIYELETVADLAAAIDKASEDQPIVKD